MVYYRHAPIDFIPIPMLSSQGLLGRAPSDLSLYGSWFSEKSDSLAESGSLWFFSVNDQTTVGESLHKIRKGYFFQLPTF
jgi:hypothetical protein